MIAKRLLAAPILAALLLSDAALACPPPPPPPRPPAQMEGESGEDFLKRFEKFQAEQTRKKELGEADWTGYRRGYETAARNAADIIALVEVTKVGSTKLKNSQGKVYGNSPQPTFKVLAFADQSKPGHTFVMEYKGLTSCGPYGEVSMVDAQLGDRFLVFGKKGKLGMKTVIAGYKEGDLLASHNKSMFTLLTRRVAEKKTAAK